VGTCSDDVAAPANDAVGDKVCRGSLRTAVVVVMVGCWIGYHEVVGEEMRHKMEESGITFQ
jgi:hypothetical protein